MCTHRPHDHL